MKIKIVAAAFLLGFSIGFICILSFTESQVDSNVYKSLHGLVIEKSDTDLSKYRKIRILCYIGTSVKFFLLRDIHIRETWGRFCDKLIFAANTTDVRLGAIGFNVTHDGHDGTWEKIRPLMFYVHDNFIDEYDWFYKCDDDTFPIVENMRYMLSAYSPNDPLYFGLQIYDGHMHGGPGYVYSNKALRLFVKNFNHCDQKLNVYEDFTLPGCMSLAGVKLVDPLDLIKRHRFFGWPAHVHIQHHSYYNIRLLISNYTISFHHIGAKTLYSMRYLTYHLRAYGNLHRHPPLPRKLRIRHDYSKHDTVNRLEQRLE